MVMFNISNPGWCTPTIIVVVLGLLVVISLIIGLIFNVKREDVNRLLISLVATLFWTIVLALILFYLCANGKTQAAWWVFGLVYLLPLAIGLFLTFLSALKP